MFEGEEGWWGGEGGEEEEEEGLLVVKVGKLDMADAGFSIRFLGVMG